MRFLVLSGLLATVAIAQTGLAQYGVLLGGGVVHPTIINNSSHRIVAYALMFDRHASIVNLMGQLRTTPVSSIGIAPGATFVHSSLHRPQTGNASGQVATYTSVSLDAVVFDDGRVVGPDQSGTLDQLTAQIQAEKDVADILNQNPQSASTWESLQMLASGQTNLASSGSRLRQFRYGDSVRASATELLRVRAAGGVAAALKVAQSSAAYPTLVKGQ